MAAERPDPFTVIRGDARSCLQALPAESVHCCVTSPPYFGLRAYKTAPQVWGGSAGCEHEWGDALPGKRSRWGDTDTLQEKQASNRGSEAMVAALERPSGNVCSRCGAWLGELGSEPSVHLYVAHLVEVFEEVRRVLRKDGTCFVNIGDSYVNAGGNGAQSENGQRADRRFTAEGMPVRGLADGLKPKDLCLVPARLAIALQEAGWWVRSDIIWQKPSPMPESVSGWTWERHQVKAARKAATQRKPFEWDTSLDRRGGIPEGRYGGEQHEAEWEDCPGCPKCEPNGGLVLKRGSGRPTRAHEYILMLAKSDRYYYDAEAIAEVAVSAPESRWDNGKNGWCSGESHDGQGSSRKFGADPAKRNARSVWAIGSEPFTGGEHYATYPVELPRRCLMAGSPPECCATCGAPYVRIIERGEPDWQWQKRCGSNNEGGYEGRDEKKYEAAGVQRPGTVKANVLAGMRRSRTTGWKPTCRYQAEASPAMVLDPFAGTGTTGVAALRNGRRFVGVELNEEYAEMAEKRLRAECGLFHHGHGEAGLGLVEELQRGEVE